MQGLVQALLDRPHDEAPDEAGVAKAHFALRRVDVDVDLAGLALDQQGRDGVPVGRQEIEIGATQRAGQRLVADRPPIDEQELLRRVRPAEGRKPHPAGKPRAFASRIEPDRICREVVAKRLAQPLGEARFALTCGRPVEGRADVGCERKAHVRRRYCGALHRIGRGKRFSPIGLEEFLSLAGVAAKRSRASTRAPTGAAQGSIALLIPPRQ